MTHEYPPNRAFDSVSISRVSALREYGLTLRQREFLVAVMVHSGCFLERQYCEFTSTVRGQNSREFMTRLMARGWLMLNALVEWERIRKQRPRENARAKQPGRKPG